MKRLLGFLVLLMWGAPAWAGAEYLGTYVWHNFEEGFGGISGIDLATDGTTFVAVGDKGIALRGRLVRTDGQITGVESAPLVKLRISDGTVATSATDDSEGVAIGADGTVYISFEGIHRVAAYPDIAGPAVRLPIPRDFKGLQWNSSLEALAIDESGALYTLPERSGRADRPFPVYRLKGGTWDVPFQIPRVGPFLPVGADIGPDGLFYLLERDYTGIGFRTRLRRFTLEGSGEETLLQTGNATHDNLEGIAVWRDGAGHMRITMIADDNFRWFQQTEIVEYRLTE